MSEMDGMLFVSVEDLHVQPADLRKVLSSFGELMSFSKVDESHDQVCGFPG